MQIRRMRKEDVKTVSELEKVCFSVPWSEKELSECLGKEIYRFFVAEEEEKVLGYIGMYLCIDEADITNVAVFPEARGRGIGEALLAALMSGAREDGAAVFYLEVRDSNVPARRLYEKQGFRIIGKRKDYYTEPTEDAVLYGYSEREEEQENSCS